MTVRRGARLPVLLAVALLWAVSACSGSGGSEGDGAPTDYQPVADRELFAAVQSLPAVSSSDVEYVDELGETNTYRGTVRLAPGADAEEVTRVYDQVVEILRHGRYDAAYVVKVVSGDVVSSRTSLELFTPADFDRRYGAQTGRRDWPPGFVTGGS